MDGVHNTYIRLNPYGHFHETDINAVQKCVSPAKQPDSAVFSKFIGQFHHFLYLLVLISISSKAFSQLKILLIHQTQILDNVISIEMSSIEIMSMQCASTTTNLSFLLFYKKRFIGYSLQHHKRCQPPWYSQGLLLCPWYSQGQYLKHFTKKAINEGLILVPFH